MTEAEFGCNDPKLLTDLFNAVTAISDEATFKISETGLSTRVMDPSRVCMIDLEISKFFFDIWTPENLRFCTYLNNLLKLLKRAKKDDHVTVIINQEKEKIFLVLTDLNGKNQRDFLLSLLEPENEDLTVPKIDLPAKIFMTVQGLQELISDALLASDHIRFDVREDQVKASSKGDLITAEATLNRESDAILDLKVEKPCKAIYPLGYLSDVVKAGSRLSNLVTLDLGEDLPVKITFSLPFDGHLVYYLAPRIEVD